jgi:hypothetical protein
VADLVMETLRTVLMYVVMATALAWSALFLCIFLNGLGGRTNPNFTDGKNRHHLSPKPWPWWLRVILSPVWGALILLLAWLWFVFIVPLLIIKRGQRMKALIRG